MFEPRPWGGYEVLADEPTRKVKRLTVEPGRRLSYQRHAHRAEHWLVVGGVGVVTLDGVERPVAEGVAVDVPVRTAHRIASTGAEPLVFIEVQLGSSFDEEDIERLDDDYGRAGTSTGSHPVQSRPLGSDL